MVIANVCVLFGLAISIAQERVCIPTGTRTLEQVSLNSLTCKRQWQFNEGFRVFEKIKIFQDLNEKVKGVRDRLKAALGSQKSFKVVRRRDHEFQVSVWGVFEIVSSERGGTFW